MITSEDSWRVGIGREHLAGLLYKACLLNAKIQLVNMVLNQNRKNSWWKCCAISSVLLPVSYPQVPLLLLSWLTFLYMRMCLVTAGFPFVKEEEMHLLSVNCSFSLFSWVTCLYWKCCLWLGLGLREFQSLQLQELLGWKRHAKATPARPHHWCFYILSGLDHPWWWG